MTVSLSSDFLSSARLGEWLSARGTVTRMGRRMAFANCDLFAGAVPDAGRHVPRSSAVFAFVDRPPPPESFVHGEPTSRGR